MKAVKISVLTAAILLTGAMVVNGQMGMQKEMMKGERPPHPKMKSKTVPSYGEPFSMEALKETLGLTEEQLSKMKSLRVSYEKERIKKEAEIKIAELEFVELLDQKELDMPKIEAKLKLLGSLQAELGFFRVKKLQETRTFLSPEQFTQFKAYTHQAVGPRMGKKGKMSPHPMGMGGMMGPGMMQGEEEE
jgi:Spy/CpxP family protein refolding chaperone